MKSLRNEIYLSRLHWPVTTLGYGKRVGIWFQGCSIRCKGCCSQNTWDVNSSTLTSVDAVMEWIANQNIDEVDGFTISGGEPFDQADALGHLLSRLRKQYSTVKSRDVLVYSGYPWQLLSKKHADVIRHVDVLISEPFVVKRCGAYLRGSDNQSLHLLSPLAEDRYASNGVEQSVRPHLQFHYDGKSLWMIGIPRSGDLQRIVENFAASGIKLGETSWR